MVDCSVSDIPNSSNNCIQMIDVELMLSYSHHICNDIKILFRSWRLPPDETLQVADPKDKNEEVSILSSP